jgi:DNA polymerase-3 subunit chi
MTSNIDFYLLEQESLSRRQNLCCRLAEKAYQQGQSAWIFVPSIEEENSLDQLLWTYKDASFIPHEVAGQEPPHAPIVISSTVPPDPAYSILINCHDIIPENFLAFTRILEVLPKKTAREHYRHYQQHQCPIKTHKLNPT